ncbi:MAG: hypothetical protein IT426_10860 [Pirellulales bacterium]|nr:hypothetical protein [Pirellulales bacterium]
MFYRIFTIALLLLGLPQFGCEKPTSGSLADSSLRENGSDRAKTDDDLKKEKIDAPVKDRDRHEKAEKPAGEKKSASLKNSTEKYRFRWSEEKESDLPLIIEMQPIPAPEEIQGPFPADAAWRTEKKTPEKKTPEKKTKKSIWPWN